MQQFFQLLKTYRYCDACNGMGSYRRKFMENDFPIRGRRDYPLLFDRNYQPKEFIQKMIDEQSDTTAIAQK